MKKPNILLIGVGRFGKNHLRVLKDLERENLCSLYGVVDINQSILKKVSRKYKVIVSTDLNNILDGADAVDIVTPSKTHFNICKRCLDAGKHVFVEKPLTTSYTQAKELVQLAREQGKILMTGHIFRYNEAVREIKRLMDKGALGRVYYMFGHFMGLKNPRNDIGALYNYAVHHIDVYNYLLDEIPEEILCCTGHFLGRRDLEDMFVLTLRYPSNILGIVEGSWLPPGKIRDLTVVGSKRSIIADLLKQTIEIYDCYIEEREGRLKAVDKGKRKIKITFEEPLRLELLDFIKSIRTGREPLASGESALKAILVVEKALKSAELGRSVRIVEEEFDD